MIVTWLADVSALHEEAIYQRYYEQLPAFRKEKADRLKMQEDKALSAGAWVLLEEMKKEYSLHDNFIFNISHSGDYALCTIAVGKSAQEVGCDIEKIRGNRMGVAKRYFCAEECEQIQNAEDFYRFWVLKESFMKATREGMKLPLNAFSFAFTSEGVPYLTKKPEKFMGKYYFKEYTMERIPYKIAVCADVNTFAEEIVCIRL